MKSIIVSSNCSGVGKTTFTLGLMKALKNRGLEIQGYKIGPDYIDPAFHKEVTGNTSRNLDVFLMGEDGVKYSYLRGNGNVGIIEGAMGLYDGIGASEKASAYDISRLLDNMPILLVLSPKGQSSTLCAEINGLKDYRKANIVGVILNSISEKYYNLLKYAIEENCNVKVFGYIPKEDKIVLSSRHLGLVQSVEVFNIEEKIEICGNLIEEYIDLNCIINEMKEFKDSIKNNYQKYKLKNQGIKICVALDKAFNFYYKDNIELLEQIGEVIYFSPMNDISLPKDIDFLYIGGGYPEVFKEELEKNETMKNSIRNALSNGLRCYAECGGLMYLTKSIEGSQMVGFFDGESKMTNRLQRFGYCNVNINKKCFNKQISVNAHEFHKSQVCLNEEKVYIVEKTQYNNEKITWSCGYHKKNTVAGYAHINFIGNIEFLKTVLNYKE